LTDSPTPAVPAWVRGIDWSCPVCAAPLELAADAWTCPADHRFAVVDGIPQLSAVDAADDGADYKLRQLEFYDEEDPEFEATRPRGTPQFYDWLMHEKLRRGTSALPELADGLTVFCVCGGSGMDGELLARAGAKVVVSDISPGAVARAQRRADETGLPIAAVVADAEHLPLADDSVDVAFVHDGLHHLADPMVGIDEMARIARRAVLVTEPAVASVTALAVRAGLALEVEDAGNRVERLRPADVADRLRSHGFTVEHAARYGMYYQHEPGPVVRFASRKRVFPLASRGLRAANAVGGGLGNKMSVQAVRRPGA